MTDFNQEAVTGVFEAIDKFLRQQREYQEKALAEIIQNYDFAVGSKESKARLMEILPEGANIICSPYIEDPTMIYAIKKFNILEYILGEEAESEKKSCNTCKNNDDEFSGECYECVKNIQNHHKAESEK